MKLTKATELFVGSRREMVLLSYQVLQTKANEKRIKMAVRIPLSNRALVGIPGWLGDAFEPMAEDSSAQMEAKLDRMLEGMTCEFFSTDSIRNVSLSLTGITIKDLKLVRKGEAEKAEVSLVATLYSPANIQAHQWCWENLRSTFWCGMEYSQTELSFKDDEEDEDSEDSEEENFMGPEHDKEFSSSPAIVKPRRGRPHANA